MLFKYDFWYSYWALVISVMITISLVGYFVRSPLCLTGIPYKTKKRGGCAAPL